MTHVTRRTRTTRRTPQKKNFRPKIFFNQKWTSMKMICGGIKQSFWTWGFLNWIIRQRFYLNWSLTLKTKSWLNQGKHTIPFLDFLDRTYQILDFLRFTMKNVSCIIYNLQLFKYHVFGAMHHVSQIMYHNVSYIMYTFKMELYYIPLWWYL